MDSSSSMRDDARRRLLFALAALGAGLGGCGGGGGASSDPIASAPPSTPTPTPPASPSPPAPSPAPSPAPPPASPSPPASPPPPAPAPAGSSVFSVASLGAGAALNGARAFPASNAWNTDISAAPVDPLSDTLIASIGLATGLHPDFGAGLYNGAPIGIPYVVVAGTQTPVAIRFTAYGDESDPGPYPVPSNAPIEGGPSSTGDRHVLVLDRDHDRLYELFGAVPNGDGSWNADCGALFHLDSNTVRPGGQPGWTSADAAGLPIFPGLARYEEAQLGPGGIRHALRFTAAR